MHIFLIRKSYCILNNSSMAGGYDLEDNMASHILDDNNYGQNILKKLNEFRLGAKFTDTVLCIGQEEFPCHKSVLAVSSPYFQAMFSSDLKESRENRISFNEVSPWTLSKVIEYAYSGKIEVNANNAQELLAAACLFQYPAIVNACEAFLEKQLHPSNCLGIEMFAHLHNCVELQGKSHQYAMENFTAVTDNDEFLDLPLDRLQDYISSDHIDVRNEDIVFKAVMRWVKFDLDKRERHLPDLLENVRLVVLDSSVLDTIEHNPLVCASEKCLSIIHEAQQLKVQSFHETQAGKRRRSMQDQSVQPRPSTVAKEVIVVIGGIPNDSQITNSVEMFDPHKERWINLTEFPQKVVWCSVTVLANSIYVAGGIVDGKIVSRVWRFDAVDRQWYSVAPMLKARARHAAASLDDKMYVLGGVRYEGKMLTVETIECYNSHTNIWTAAGRTMSPRKESYVVPYNNTIVEVGGLQREEAVVKTMDSYHTVENSIRPFEQFVLPENIQFAKIVVINAVFYILWEDSKKMIALNAQKRTFKHLPNMPCSRRHSGATVVNGKIYVCGGLIDAKPTDLVECFDPVTETWTSEQSMLEARAYHGCVTLKMC